MDINELFFIGHNKYGQAGIGEQQHNKHYELPHQILFKTYIKQVSCGSHHSALLTIEGSVYTMGSNIHGTLGCQSIINYSFKPIKVANLSDVSKIQSGSYHMCAISQGQLFSWGKGIQGQLGHGNMKNIFHPLKVQTLGNDVQNVSCGANHTLVLTAKEEERTSGCYGFGSGIFGQLGTGSNRNFCQPVKVKLQNIQMISAGQNHSLFVSNNQMFGCGDNSHFQICHDIDGKVKKYILEPVKINLNTQNKECQFQDIVCNQLSCSLDDSGDLYIWGGQNNIWPAHKITNMNGLNIKTFKSKVYVSKKDGKLSEIQIDKGQNPLQQYRINQKFIYQGMIMDYSIGDIHLFIVGDIKTQIQNNTQSPNILQTIKQFKNQQAISNNQIIKTKTEQLENNHQQRYMKQNMDEGDQDQQINFNVKQLKMQYSQESFQQKHTLENSSQIQTQINMKQMINLPIKNKISLDQMQLSFNNRSNQKQHNFSIQKQRQKLLYLMNGINDNVTHLTKKNSIIKYQTFQNSQSSQQEEIQQNKVHNRHQKLTQFDVNLQNYSQLQEHKNQNKQKKQMPIQKIFRQLLQKQNLKAKTKQLTQNKQNINVIKHSTTFSNPHVISERILQAKNIYEIQNSMVKIQNKYVQKQNNSKYSPKVNLGVSNISQKSNASAISCSNSNIRKTSQIYEITKCNRMLRSQLRQRDLKISKLQEALSQKQTQIQKQRKIIQNMQILLAKQSKLSKQICEFEQINLQNYGDTQN